MDPMAVTHSYQFHAYKIIILKITANISFLTTKNILITLMINAQIYMYQNRLSEILNDTTKATCDRTLWTKGGGDALNPSTITEPSHWWIG